MCCKVLFGVSLLVWIGVLGVFVGFNGVVLILFGVISLVLFWFYCILC